MRRHNACPACSSERIKPLSSFSTEQLHRCTFCGLVFEARIPSDAELAAHYSQYGYSKLKPCSSATQASYRNVLASFLPWHRHGRLLDFGCGQGDFLSQATSAGWQAEGLEYAPDAVALCQSRGLRVTQGDASTLIRDGAQFDVISAFEVLEHLRAPGELLGHAWALLQPGGLLYLTTPNFNALLRHFEADNFSVVSYPDHLCFFTLESLSKLVTNHGFKVARLRSTGLDPWRLKNAILARSSPPSGTSDCQPHFFAPNRLFLSSRVESRVALRESMYASRWAALAKQGVNSIVNAFRCGDTLKAWLVKI